MAPDGLPVQSIRFNVTTSLAFLAARGLVVGHTAAAEVVAALMSDAIANATQEDIDWGQVGFSVTLKGTILPKTFFFLLLVRL